jgi:hypothetical protein
MVHDDNDWKLLFLFLFYFIYLFFFFGVCRIVGSDNLNMDAFVVLSNVVCSGSEVSLLQCLGNWTLPDETKPAVSNAVFVDCQLEGDFISIICGEYLFF